MTIRKRLARSNLAMLVIPVLVAAVLLLIGMAIGYVLLRQVYLPQLGVTLQQLHQTGEQMERLLSGPAAIACIYAGAVAAALLATVALTNLYLTRSLFRHIAGPLDTLTAGVARIRDGDLDTPIAYSGADEFRAACDAVDEMAARLKASLEQQQQERQKKQELIAGMSHDLKSPLTSIRAYTEALLDGVARDEQTRRRYLQTIHTREAEMETMVNRLFAFARMEASAYPVRPEPVQLRPFLQALGEEWSSGAMEVRLEVPRALCVLADPELLRRIAENLLGNSQKYGGRETVHVLISARALGAQVELSFSDDGVGVTDEQLPRLFDAFYRADAARTAPGGGSGLGLAVVRRAVEQMGGTVRAAHGADGGLCILFTLPEAKEEQHAENSDS